MREMTGKELIVSLILAVAAGAAAEKLTRKKTVTDLGRLLASQKDNDIGAAGTDISAGGVVGTRSWWVHVAAALTGGTLAGVGAFLFAPCPGRQVRRLSPDRFQRALSPPAQTRAPQETITEIQDRDSPATAKHATGIGVEKMTVVEQGPF